MLQRTIHTAECFLLNTCTLCTVWKGGTITNTKAAPVQCETKTKLVRKMRPPFQPCEASTAANIATLIVEHPLSLPWQALSMPLSFLPLCQHESLYSWTMTQTRELIQLKTKLFFFPGCVTSTLSQFWFTVWLQENLFQPKERLSKKKETSTTIVEVLDFISWKWYYGAMKVKTTPSYKTSLLYSARQVAPSPSSQFHSI